MAKNIHKTPKTKVEPPGDRTPRSVISPSGGKKPRILGTGLAADPTVVWSFALIDLDGRWGWRNFESSQHLETVLQRLRDWEQMRATEMFGRGGCKLIPFHNLCRDAQRRVEELTLDDFPGLWELRLSGEIRIWGHREGHIFYPLWWDPLHEVCPSYKKHT